MKKLLLTILLVISGKAFADHEATNENFCTYGGSINGAVQFDFTKISNPMNAFFTRYESKLSEKLIITINKVQGHSARYSLTANFDNGLVTMYDEYVDFAQPRILHLSGSVEGKSLYCQFNPETY